MHVYHKDRGHDEGDNYHHDDNDYHDDDYLRGGSHLARRGWRIGYRSNGPGSWVRLLIGLRILLLVRVIGRLLRRVRVVAHGVHLVIFDAHNN